MAKQAKLTAERRTAIGQSAVQKIKRQSGSVPAVIYGSKDKPEALLGFPAATSTHCLATPPAKIFWWSWKSLGRAGWQLVQERFSMPRWEAPFLHIDFHAVSRDEVIDADPFRSEPVGMANGVAAKNAGGLLEAEPAFHYAIEMSAARPAGCDSRRRFCPQHWRRNPCSGDPVARWRHHPHSAGPGHVAFSVLAPTVEEEPTAAVAEASAGPEVIKGEGKEEPEGGAAPKEKRAERNNSAFASQILEQNASQIRLVVGLGNPGAEYKGTRHNIGFEVVDRLAAEWGLTWEHSKGWRAFLAKGQKAILVKPS